MIDLPLVGVAFAGARVLFFLGTSQPRRGPARMRIEYHRPRNRNFLRRRGVARTVVVWMRRFAKSLGCVEAGAPRALDPEACA